MEETKKEVVKKEVVKKVETKSILRNTSGKEVPEADYFYKGIIPAGFLGTCGKPVDRRPR